jgi:hypothetical protein
MKCKRAAWLLPLSLRKLSVQAAYLLHSSALAAKLTRSRKVAAESIFCYDLIKE